jgi:hypothetical protein
MNLHARVVVGGLHGVASPIDSLAMERGGGAGREDVDQGNSSSVQKVVNGSTVTLPDA